MTKCPKCQAVPLPYSLVCSWCANTGLDGLIKYAGIGSRETPAPIAAQMSMIGAMLGAKGYILRSGAAKRPVNAPAGTDSADLCFQRGCESVAGRRVIRVSTQHQKALYHAALYHPNWHACDEYARALHARNSQIVMGDGFDDPVRFIVAHTDGGAVKGGTGQGLRIAEAHNIPVFNFGLGYSIDQFWSWLASGGL